MTPQPFEIAVPASEVDDMYRRLRDTRWAPDFGNQDWAYGVERNWLQSMVDYWRNDYDWRERERVMNSYPQFIVDIEGVRIHFLHIKGKGKRSRPLILSHGWPWTFWDFHEMIGPLTDPAAYGAPEAEPFDLIIPSLPGYGFSMPLEQTGVDVPRIAHLWNRLMTEVLGYSRYAAAGGDWGAAVTAQLGHTCEANVVGILMTLGVVPGADFTQLKPEDFAKDEAWMIARNAEALPLISSHIAVHTHDPQTLAYALVDSPVGTAAWLWERRRTWSDCNGDVLRSYSKEFLCDLASIYWLTGSIASSIRLYAENFRRYGATTPLVHDRKPTIAVPTAYAVFPKDVALTPRAIAQANVNLQRWSVMPSGGHFGPAEKPRETAGEIHEFFAPLI